MDVYENNEHSLLYIYFCLATLFTQVILFNYLIAILSDTYTKIMEQKDHFAIYQRTMIYADFIHCIKAINIEQPFMYVIKPDEENDDEQLTSFYVSIKNRIQKLEQKLEKQSDKTQQQVSRECQAISRECNELRNLIDIKHSNATIHLNDKIKEMDQHQKESIKTLEKQFETLTGSLTKEIAESLSKDIAEIKNLQMKQLRGEFIKTTPESEQRLREKEEKGQQHVSESVNGGGVWDAWFRIIW